MAHAYTPGLKVSAKSKIKKTRKLPLLGEVLVKLNDTVKDEQLVAKTELPGKVYPINVAGNLGLGKANELPGTMLKKIGDSVKKGELVAQTKGIFGFFKSEYNSPITGTISQISQITGQVVFNAEPIPVEINAFVSGNVTNIYEKEGVDVETEGVHIQGILGLGGETFGDIHILAKATTDVLTEDMITSEMKGKILVGGAKLTSDALLKAAKIGVKGIISGGFEYEDVRSILGKDLGVAITGHEKIGITLILTEGFGNIPMADRTFELLGRYEGHKASINGATQIRAGVMRPEIIITHEKEEKDLASKNYAESGIEIGDQIRVIRTPYFGKLGIVKGLPVELTQLDSGAWVRVLKAEIDGKTVIVPRANIEMIEK